MNSESFQFRDKIFMGIKHVDVYTSSTINYYRGLMQMKIEKNPIFWASLGKRSLFHGPVKYFCSICKTLCAPPGVLVVDPIVPDD